MTKKILVLRSIEHDKNGWRHEPGDILDRLPKGCPAQWLDGEHLTECFIAEEANDGDGQD